MGSKSVTRPEQVGWASPITRWIRRLGLERVASDSWCHLSGTDVVFLFARAFRFMGTAFYCRWRKKTNLKFGGSWLNQVFWGRKTYEHLCFPWVLRALGSYRNLSEMSQSAMSETFTNQTAPLLSSSRRNSFHLTEKHYFTKKKVLPNRKP